MSFAWRLVRRSAENPKRTLKNAAIIGATGATVAGAAGIAAGWLTIRAIRKALMDDVRGQVVLITGSSRGLGFAMAKEFATLGARLVICARDTHELDWARQELEARGADVFAVQCDVSNNDQVHEMVRRALARYGRIDILVNNAGVIEVGPLKSQTLADFDEAMQIMFWGVVHPTLAALPHMLERHSGRIANITSIGGKVSVPHLLPYCCAKFAAVGFSEGLHAEVARDGITVTTVVPGLMRTGSHVNAYFKGDQATEYNMFALSATSPLTAMSGHRAARQIVRAIRMGRAEVILTPQAKLAALIHGIAPGQTSNLMGLVNRLLPGGDSERKSRVVGKQTETPITRSPLTALGRIEGKKLHQYPERHERAGGELPQAQMGD
jgi:NAD(P)-dependent dehydrogenase (short-subunit alcohol dehydrogenase family)